jgi:hypothetical protein
MCQKTVVLQKTTGPLPPEGPGGKRISLDRSTEDIYRKARSRGQQAPSGPIRGNGAFGPVLVSSDALRPSITLVKDE